MNGREEKEQQRQKFNFEMSQKAHPELNDD